MQGAPDLLKCRICGESLRTRLSYDKHMKDHVGAPKIAKKLTKVKNTGKGKLSKEKPVTQLLVKKNMSPFSENSDDSSDDAELNLKKDVQEKKSGRNTKIPMKGTELVKKKNENPEPTIIVTRRSIRRSKNVNSNGSNTVEKKSDNSVPPKTQSRPLDQISTEKTAPVPKAGDKSSSEQEPIDDSALSQSQRDFKAYLNGKDLSQYFKLFVDNGYDTIDRFHLIKSIDTLKSMGMNKMGHMSHIIELIQEERNMRNPLKQKKKELETVPVGSPRKVQLGSEDGKRKVDNVDGNGETEQRKRSRFSLKNAKYFLDESIRVDSDEEIEEDPKDVPVSETAPESVQPPGHDKILIYVEKVGSDEAIELKTEPQRDVKKLIKKLAKYWKVDISIVVLMHGKVQLKSGKCLADYSVKSEDTLKFHIKVNK